MSDVEVMETEWTDVLLTSAAGWIPRSVEVAARASGGSGVGLLCAAAGCCCCFPFLEHSAHLSFVGLPQSHSTSHSAERTNDCTLIAQYET